MSHLNRLIDDGNALEAMNLARRLDADGDRVEYAKAMVLAVAAWWPGGRTAQKAFCASPFCTTSTAAQTAPAARIAAPSEPGALAAELALELDLTHAVRDPDLENLQESLAVLGIDMDSRKSAHRSPADR